MIYFIAAGKGSRMNSKIPKPLQTIENSPVIVNNIKMLNVDYRIVIDKSALIDFAKYFDVKQLITINSGLGSGHAIMQLDLQDDDIIIWGDTYFKSVNIINELINIKSNSPLVIPIKRVHNPYVNFLIDKNFNIQEVLFSKYGEISVEGYQDCCIFKVKSSIIKYLKDIHNSIWKSRYITESNEFEFLYIIHYLYNINIPAFGYLTEFEDNIFSFNTLQELKSIEKEIQNAN